MTKTGVLKRGQCRIIAGKWRGRTIKFEDADGLRPTTDRIRETVFNWLQPYLSKSVCLDCFAGSGVLGFEAISRGVDSVVFIEKNKATAKSLRENAGLLRASNASVLQADIFDWLQAMKMSVNPEKIFDLVFLDPPFHLNLLGKSCAALVSSGCLAADAIIYVEHAVDEAPVFPDNWVCLKDKKSGQVRYKIFEHQLIG